MSKEGIYTKIDRALEERCYMKSPSVAIFPTENLRGRPSYILKNTRKNTYMRIGPREHYILNLLKQKRDLSDIEVSYFLKYSSILTNTKEFIKPLRINHFVEPEYDNVYEKVKLKGTKNSLRKYLRRVSYNDNIDGYLSKVYRLIGKTLFHPLTLVILTLMSLHSYYYMRRHFDFSGLFDNMGRQQIVLDLIILLITKIIYTYVHEMGHGLMLKHFGGRIHKGGVISHFGIPSFFLDTNDSLILSYRKRIWVSLAGPLSSLLLNGIVLHLGLLLVPSSHHEFIYRPLFWGTLSFFINMNPLLYYDGYYILIDFLNFPRLKETAEMTVIQSIKKRKIKVSGKREAFLLFYGICNYCWPMFLLGMVTLIMHKRIIGLWEELSQSSSWIYQALIVLLALVTILPIVLSIGFLLLNISSRVLQKLGIGFWGLSSKTRSILASIICVSSMKWPLLASIAFVPMIFIHVKNKKAMTFQIGYLWQVKNFFVANIYYFLGSPALINLPFEISSGRYFWSLLSLSSFWVTPHWGGVVFAFCYQLLEQVLGSEISRGSVDYDIPIDKNNRDLIYLFIKKFNEQVQVRLTKRYGKIYGIYHQARIKTKQLDEEIHLDLPFNTICQLAAQVYNKIQTSCHPLCGKQFLSQLTEDILDHIDWRGREVIEENLLGIINMNNLEQKKVDINWGHVPSFANLPEDLLVKLSLCVNYRRFQSGERIIEQGTEGNCLYILKYGLCEVIQHDKSVAFLGAGDIFGETSLLKNEKRNASIVARKETLAISLTKSNFISFCEKYPIFKELMEKNIQSRFKMESFLKNVGLFKTLDDKSLQYLSLNIQVREYDGQMIFKEGDLGGEMYIIKSGNVSIVKDVDGVSTIIKELTSGEYFGEMSLFSNKPRSSSVKARGKVILYIIQNEHLSQLMKSINPMIERVSGRRTKDQEIKGVAA